MLELFWGWINYSRIKFSPWFFWWKCRVPNDSLFLGNFLWSNPIICTTEPEAMWHFNQIYNWATRSQFEGIKHEVSCLRFILSIFFLNWYLVVIKLIHFNWDLFLILKQPCFLQLSSFHNFLFCYYFTRFQLFVSFNCPSTTFSVWI